MWKSYGAILLFAVIFWIARIYTITPYWDGTDGNGLLANIFLQNLKGPYYLENVMVDGKYQFATPCHPACLYEIPRLLGVIINPLLHLETANSLVFATTMKLISAVLQYVFFGSLFWMGLTRKYACTDVRYYVCSVIILASVSPLALTSSNEFQTDTLSGVVLIGGATLILLVSSQTKAGPASVYMVLALAGILLGCGKNEWSLAFMMAILASCGIGALMRRKDICLKVGAVGAGILGGNFMSDQMDGVNYWRGWQLLSGMVTSHSALDASKLDHVFKNLPQTFPFVMTLYLLAFFSCALAIVSRKVTAESLLLFFLGVALMGGYILSSWLLVPRYFYPSLLLLLGFFFLCSDGLGPKLLSFRWLFPLLALLLAGDVYFDSTLFQRSREIRAWQRQHGAIVLQPLSENEVYVLDMSFLLPKLDRNYVHGWVGDEAIVRYLQWAQKKPKLDGIREYPPYTTLPITYKD